MRRTVFIATICVIAATTTLIGAETSAPATAQTPATTQTPAPPPHPCSGEKFRQFDFWVGSWDVADPSGKQAGHNEISHDNRCVVVERWRSVQGGTGISLNYYDPRAAKWRQRWVGGGGILDMEGGMKDGSMVLEGPLQDIATRRVTLLRGTWTPLPDGRVRQHFVESADEGKTWTDWFDGYYTRAKPAASQ
jgi:hypothetical protein